MGTVVGKPTMCESSICYVLLYVYVFTCELILSIFSYLSLCFALLQIFKRTQFEMDLLDGKISSWFTAFGTIPTPKRLIISDDMKEMFERMLTDQNFGQHLRLHPPAFPKREVPNEYNPITCRCRYCSVHPIEVPCVRYGMVTKKMWDEAIRRRVEKCQIGIRKLVISDEQRKLLGDLCNNHRNLSIRPAYLFRERRCVCKHCNPSSKDFSAAVKILLPEFKYGEMTFKQIQRIKNSFNVNCPHNLGVRISNDFRKPYVEFDENKTPHSPRSKDISIAIKDAEKRIAEEKRIIDELGSYDRDYGCKYYDDDDDRDYKRDYECADADADDDEVDWGSSCRCMTCRDEAHA